MTHPDRLDPDDQVQLKQILTRCPELEAAAGHVRGFATMMTNRHDHLLDRSVTRSPKVVTSGQWGALLRTDGTAFPDRPVFT